MLFNSYAFLLGFAPVAFGVYWLLRHKNTWRLAWLALLGYVFYAFFDIRYVPLLALITLINYWAGRQIAAGNRPLLWLRLSLGTCLGVLTVYKYAAVTVGTPNAQGILPVGISFYIFQSLTYPLDLSHQRTQPARSPIHFAAFVALFPTLASGPITRWSQIGQKLLTLPERLDTEKISEGIQLFILGLTKKVLIADTLSERAVTPLFNMQAPQGFVASWLAALTFSVQLYMDFSAYTDMARGLGLLLGVVLPRNFTNPYGATNIADFWNRWHISLSTWFRDYLFLPLSRTLMQRAGKLHPDLLRAIAYFITMGLIGLWHGVSWPFVLWGTYHGLLLVVYHQTRSWAKLRWAWFNRLLTFVAVVVGWVLFRSASVGQAVTIWKGMLGLNGIETFNQIKGFLPTASLTAGVIIWLVVIYGRWKWTQQMPRTVYSALILGLLAAIAFGMLTKIETFVYFRF